ncbi:MAG: D-alanine--D-alanine ligase family protein [Clostridia bacterium]|nr:D-alanine--D-alanine ligase family protein [Clostridia bacterium]
MKIELLVIFGGQSTEHEISNFSAFSVINTLDREKYNINKLGITKSGAFFLYEGREENIKTGQWAQDFKNLKPAYIIPEEDGAKLLVKEKDKFEKRKIDVAFPVLHGQNGEDGTIQGLFMLYKIPFVGCDMTSSAVCMDKVLTNTLSDYFNIPQAKWQAMTKKEYIDNPNKLNEIAELLSYPIFIKPARAGSSVGVTKAENKDMLISGTEKAFQQDDKILFEEFIDGYEVECAVLGNDDLILGVPGQIKSAGTFYDYESKYKNAESKTIIPAEIDEKIQKEIMNWSKKIYFAMGCSGLSRVDFFVEKQTGKVKFNEINTIPGFTDISMYPKMIEKAGIEYEELLNRLINLAKEKWSK